MPTDREFADLKTQVKLLQDVARAIQGGPASALISIPHIDSWLFEDNVDGTHPANLRYVVPAVVQRVVSARLSIHLAPYRTYNTLSVSATGTESVGHVHGHSATHFHSHTHGGHQHSIHIIPTVDTVDTLTSAGAGAGIGSVTTGVAFDTSQVVNGTTPSADATAVAPGSTDGESATHTHNISASGVLGVTEGATATGVTLTFDGGPDVSGNFGGPFTVDQIELNVLPYLISTKGLWHTIAMQPSGLGRIEAHLRLGVYVAAGSVF